MFISIYLWYAHISLSIYLTRYDHIYLPIYLTRYDHIYLSIYLTRYDHIYLSIYLSILQRMIITIYLWYVHVYIHLSMVCSYLSIYHNLLISIYHDLLTTVNLSWSAHNYLFIYHGLFISMYLSILSSEEKCDCNQLSILQYTHAHTHAYRSALSFPPTIGFCRSLLPDIFSLSFSSVSLTTDMNNNTAIELYQFSYLFFFLFFCFLLCSQFLLSIFSSSPSSTLCLSVSHCLSFVIISPLFR
ncbi:unnamed protein product [Acanthosepion pharaonis]|uniref:Uncharacterized protein n=1 Tax=Acanthosepion pharaonis TaxID=158019 RepID=A0A812AZJ2_ACAPH|nr:unnamed protein product [Sepia pharaonis]